MSDPRGALIDAVNALHEQTPKPELACRIDAVVLLIDGYVDATGLRPPSASLRRMADYLLIDEMVDTHKQHRGTEYPFHTATQTNRRRQREYAAHDDPRLG